MLYTSHGFLLLFFVLHAEILPLFLQFGEAEDLAVLFLHPLPLQDLPLRPRLFEIFDVPLSGLLLGQGELSFPEL
jgi:hypothetical protein